MFILGILALSHIWSQCAGFKSAEEHQGEFLVLHRGVWGDGAGGFPGTGRMAAAHDACPSSDVEQEEQQANENLVRFQSLHALHLKIAAM